MHKENTPSISENSHSPEKVKKEEKSSLPLEENSRENHVPLTTVRSEVPEDNVTELGCASKSAFKLVPTSETKVQPKSRVLSLKIRKRKYRVTSASPPCDQTSKKPCTLNSSNEEQKSPSLDFQTKVEHIKNSVKKNSSFVKPLSPEDKEMMLGYTESSLPPKKLTLADLEQFEQTKQAQNLEEQTFLNNQNVSQFQQIKQTPFKSQSSKHSTKNISLTPTFSPRKSTPTSFTHVLTESNRELDTPLDKPIGSQPLDTSVPLFSTPALSENKPDLSLSLRRCSSSKTVKETPKRVLFESEDASQGEKMVSTSLHSHESGKSSDFSFGDDFDISELMDHSGLMEQSCDLVKNTRGSGDLNRYLVLEATTQECVEQNRAAQNYTNQ